MWFKERLFRGKTVEMDEEAVTEADWGGRTEEFERLTAGLERNHNTSLTIGDRVFTIQETRIGRLLIVELAGGHHGTRRAHQRSLKRTVDLLGAAGIRMPDTSFEDIKEKAEKTFRGTRFISGADIWEVAFKQTLNSQAEVLEKLLRERGVEGVGLEIVVDHLCRGLTLEELGRKFFSSKSGRK